MANSMKSSRKWYVAEIVEKISVEDDPRLVCHVNAVLVRATSDKQAYSKSLRLGKDHNVRYRNRARKRVTVSFIGLRNLYPIYDELEHGGEISYGEFITRDEKKITKLVRRKEQLTIFRPQNPVKGGPTT